MNNQIRILSITILYVLFFTQITSATTVTVSGPTTVCPGDQVTYVASASWILGDRGGSFGWSFYENGQWNVVSIINCDPNGAASSSMSYTWNYTGNNQIRVIYTPNGDPFCPITTEYMNVNVRVFPPGVASGALFCTGGETKTVTIPGIDNSEAECFYHHKYDYIVPTGWSVTSTLDPFDIIPGGIRTISKTVDITAPVSVANGEHDLIVRTEPAWPWPMETTTKMWVGEPAAPIIDGPHYKTFGCYDISISTSTPGYADNTYEWWGSQGIGVYPEYVSCKHNLPNSGVTGTSASFKFLIGTSGYIYTQAKNGCNLTTISSTYVVKSGGGPLPLTVSPNPTSNSLNFSFLEETDEDGSTVEENILGILVSDEQMLESAPALYQLIMYNNLQEQVLKDEIIEGEDTEIDISYLDKGVYFLHIIYEGEIEIKQIIKE
ncbi:MAG: T9SS type A sorting domain-containing protein [Cyclobacteriaceae bacterium]